MDRPARAGVARSVPGEWLTVAYALPLSFSPTVFLFAPRWSGTSLSPATPLVLQGRRGTSQRAFASANVTPDRMSRLATWSPMVMTRQSQYPMQSLQLWPGLQVVPIHLQFLPALPDADAVRRAGSHQCGFDGGTKLLVLRLG